MRNEDISIDHWAKVLNFTKKDKKNVKGYSVTYLKVHTHTHKFWTVSTSVIIEAMQIKIAVRYINTHQIAKTKKTDNMRCWQWSEATELSYIATGSINGYKHFEDMFGSTSYESTISLLGIDILEIYHQKARTRMFIHNNHNSKSIMDK